MKRTNRSEVAQAADVFLGHGSLDELARGLACSFYSARPLRGSRGSRATSLSRAAGLLNELAYALKLEAQALHNSSTKASRLVARRDGRVVGHTVYVSREAADAARARAR